MGTLTKQKRKNLPSHKRALNPPPFRLTKRDQMIVQSVFKFRLLSSQQIEALLFSSENRHSKQSICQRRLQLLYHHRFLDRLPIPVVLGEGRKPYIYVLDKQGVDLVVHLTGIEAKRIRWRPHKNQLSWMFINHATAVNNVRIVFSLLVQAGHFHLKSWIDESEFRSQNYRELLPYRVKGNQKERKQPDGYFQLQLPNHEQTAHFFLEVDLGSESKNQWQEKIKTYDFFPYFWTICSSFRHPQFSIINCCQ